MIFRPVSSDEDEHRRPAVHLDHMDVMPLWPARLTSREAPGTT